MAAFPYQHPCLIDSSSFLFPNTPTLLPGYENSNNKISGLLEDPNNSLPIFSQQYYYCAEESVQEVSSLNVSGTTTKVSLSNSSSMVTDQNQMKKRKSSSKLNSAQSNDTREVVEKGKKQRKNRGGGGDKKNEEKKKKVEEGAPGGYIHVRARRGQATDSHSLAERVRREKISERMKMLQALVPGCDKVTGKAIMLDEIINYVQSLQNQVEFLSMKLASMNPLFYDFGADMDNFMIKPEMMTNLEAEQQQKCSPNQLTTNPFIPPNSYHLLHSSPLLSLQQGQVPDILQQGNGQLSWDSNEHRQNIISQSGFTNNNLPSFQ